MVKKQNSVGLLSRIAGLFGLGEVRSDEPATRNVAELAPWECLEALEAGYNGYVVKNMAELAPWELEELYVSEMFLEEDGPVTNVFELAPWHRKGGIEAGAHSGNRWSVVRLREMRRSA